VFVSLDYFDASINRVAAWVIGARNIQKALLNALVLPNESLARLQKKSDFTRVLAMSEEFKTFPFGSIWDEYCERCGVPVGPDWIREVEIYEKEVLSERK
jgi:L-rhamnose isomerase